MELPRDAAQSDRLNSIVQVIFARLPNIRSVVTSLRTLELAHLKSCFALKGETRCCPAAFGQALCQEFPLIALFKIPGPLLFG
jgi:hypothetical protein